MWSCPPHHLKPIFNFGVSLSQGQWDGHSSADDTAWEGTVGSFIRESSLVWFNHLRIIRMMTLFLFFFKISSCILWLTSYIMGQ